MVKLKKMEIIHCDMKPENIMFTDATLCQVKIVDFGSACTDYASGFKYVQTRYYRAPEVTLGLKYDHAVDMWSLGCIVYELFAGRPLFPAQDENELIEYIAYWIGLPPQRMI
jgi:dual specificity tyrosine-phosphorylation-regulated kinase 2/3/4